MADVFERHTPGDGQARIGYFDAAELAAELGHCHRDLGRLDRPIAYAIDAPDNASGNYALSDFFVAMVLAEAASTVATSTRESGRRIRSCGSRVASSTTRNQLVAS